MKDAYLLLSNNECLKGVSIGYSGSTFGELVFNTSITGYQEIISDPSYKNQIITFTYPHIGNVGFNINDYPKTKSLFDELLLLPMNHMMKEEEVKYICEKINFFYDK